MLTETGSVLSICQLYTFTNIAYAYINTVFYLCASDNHHLYTVAWLAYSIYGPNYLTRHEIYLINELFLVSTQFAAHMVKGNISKLLEDNFLIAGLIRRGQLK